ncbi:MAG: hypothetical protein ACXVHL_35875 [Solirubrobacteraceae bacterium]
MKDARTTIDGYVEQEMGLIPLETLRNAHVLDLAATQKALAIEGALRLDQTTTEYLEMNAEYSAEYAPTPLVNA